MSTALLSQMFSWLAVGLTLLAALTSAIALHYRNLAAAESDALAAKKDAEIAQLKPRRLSNAQKQILISRASLEKGTVAFMHRLMDGEGKDFSQQMADAFKAAGWVVRSIAGNSLNDFPGYVVVSVADGIPNETARLACDALNAAGIECRQEPIRQGTTGGPLEPNIIYVVVGRKP
jgi:hypothetical protein